ncbi:IclR family transcriptional regulator [Kineosporia sp. R_H_3]|uniref:IclR family transcriptional regulator n=1 Tax=Kineosporia sp. R_H_3 TaxID=1961848 RepID=UPI0013042CC3|nr:IclR family transcriptional regulator [Kineosporia sp. R_H_3]
MSRAGSAGPGDSQIAQTLDRGLAVLELLAAVGGGLTVSEIAAALGIHRTVAYRLLATLERRSLVQRSTDGRYRPGGGLLRLSAGVGDELRAVAVPHLQSLHADTDETVHLAVRTGTEILFLESFESTRPLRVASRIGRTMPAHATSVGKALLATITDLEVRALYPRGRLELVGPATCRTVTELLRDLAAVRHRGYARSDQESEHDVGSVGVAVRDPEGRARAAISIAAPTTRLTGRTVADLAEAARATAAAIGSSL